MNITTTYDEAMVKAMIAEAVAKERNSWPAEMEAMERQVNILTDALHQERERMKWDIHSCGPTCKRYACVATREAVQAEREACAYKAGIALLGADRGLANRVDQAIRVWGKGAKMKTAIEMAQARRTP